MEVTRRSKKRRKQPAVRVLSQRAARPALPELSFDFHLSTFSHATGVWGSSHEGSEYPACGVSSVLFII